MSVQSLLCNDDGSGSSCLEPAETLDVESADGTNPTYKRVIRSQSVIHDADKVMLATLEAVELDLLTGNAKDRHTAKLNKLRSKVNLFVARAAAAANTVAAKKARVNFEMEDVMRLCHSRTLQEHQFRDKAINSGNTKLALVAGSYNDGFTASSCKHDLYQVKCWLDDVYPTLPKFVGEEKWEQERVINILKK